MVCIRFCDDAAGHRASGTRMWEQPRKNMLTSDLWPAESQVEIAAHSGLVGGEGARRVSVMANDWMATGWKLRMRGYRSMGDSVPLVMTTVWNLRNTGFTARLASRQLSCARAPAAEMQTNEQPQA